MILCLISAGEALKRVFMSVWWAGFQPAILPGMGYGVTSPAIMQVDQRNCQSLT